MNNKLFLSKENGFEEYFRQTAIYIFLDYVEVIPGVKARGRYIVPQDSWWAPWHFPGHPIMPGVFQMEAIMQTGGLIINTLPNEKDTELNFDSSKKVNILRGATTGDEITTEVEMLSYRRGVGKFSGRAYVNAEVSCLLEFNLIAPDVIKRIMGERHE